MHRNTYILVSVLAVIAALVVGVNFGKKITPQNPEPTPTPLVSVAPTPSLIPFVDVACGFSLTYPDTFTLIDSASGSAILRNSVDQSQSIVMTCQEDIPRPALISENIESLTLTTETGASVSAKLYHDQSQKDGTPIDALIFTHPSTKLDVFIAGYGEAFNSILQTVTVTP